MARWVGIELDAPIYQNVDEAALQGENAALENAYLTNKGHLSRFPRLEEQFDLEGDADVYLYNYNNDLMAVTGGRTYVVDPIHSMIRDVTKVHVSGGKRVIFSETDDRLLMAAGGKPVQYNGGNTKLLSVDAPETTHIAYLDGYVIAPEKNSQRMAYTENGVYESWPDLNIVSAEKASDDIDALIITEYQELIAAGEKSIEMFDTAISGDAPLYPRWSLAAGLIAPYSLISVDNRIWGVNNQSEFVAFSAQVGRIESDDIQLRLEAITNWEEAHCFELPIEGHRFIVLRIPNQPNRYGSEGITFLYDYKKKRWSELYDWDDSCGLPTVWPGVSYAKVNGTHYIGGKGKIYKLAGDSASGTQRMLFRTGHIDANGSRDIRIDGLRMRMKRGVAPTNDNSAIISIRANKNNNGFGRWIRRRVGKAGQRDMTLRFSGMGTAEQWQFEVEITDSAQIELVSMDMLREVLA